MNLTDDALLGFALWCRVNRASVVTDPQRLRRVFEAYAALGQSLADLGSHDLRHALGGETVESPEPDADSN